MKRFALPSLFVIAAILLSSCSMHLGLSKLLGGSSKPAAAVKHVKATHTPPSPPTQASGASAGAVTPTAAASVTTSTGPATVNVGTNAKYGSILTDDKGMTLYLYTKDSPNTTTCYDKCAAAWPPLLTNGNPVAGSGLDASKFGTVTRTDGTTQVTYNGWALYYYAKDANPGDATGQNVGSVWFVVSPSGEAIKQ
jgi:predicted lipoprotein with Yx(FWY)xxD motif